MLELKQLEGAVSFRVRVAPRAAREAIAGTHAGALKVSLTAPATEGRANEALCELLATALSVPRRAVQIRHGAHTRLKTVHVTGVDAAAVRGLVGGDAE